MKEIDNIIKNFDDFDIQNFEIAKWIFFKEEGRTVDLNNIKDMNVIAILETGVRYMRKYIK